MWTKAGVAGRGGGAGAAALAAAGRRPRTPAQDEDVLRIGWAQDPQTLNPFVGLDEEDYTIWAMNWDLLVNFSPEDLSPAPGIAESWEVSEDRKTVTFHLDPDAKWSDGEPITSADVKYSLETLGGEGDPVHRLHRQRHLDRDARRPDGRDQDQAARRPDRRRPVHLHPPRARLGQGAASTSSPAPTSRSCRWSAAGRTSSPSSSAGGSCGWSRTRSGAARSRSSTRSSSSSYGNQDAAERALQLGEVDLVPEVSAGELRAARRGGRTSRRCAARTPAYTELAFNLCSEEDCPDAEFNPAVQDRAVRQAIAYAIDRERINEIAAQGTSFVAHGILPSFYKSFYEVPEKDYPLRPRAGEPDPRRRRLGARATTVRGRRAARSSRSTSTCARSRRPTSRRRS